MKSKALVMAVVALVCGYSQGQEAEVAPTVKVVEKPVTVVADADSIARALNLANTGTEEQLTKVKRVGTKTAQAIVEYRKKNGLFESLDDLDAVPRIGVATIRNFLQAVEVKTLPDEETDGQD